LVFAGEIIRPPSEAESLIIVVTTGCSHNKCTFCRNTISKEKFGIRSFDEIRVDIDEAAGYLKGVKRVFFAGRDSLITPFHKLEEIFLYINHKFPTIERIGMYANVKSILMKKPDELKTLKELGLGIVYIGVETGDDELLKKIRKGVNSEKIIRASKKVSAAGIMKSVMIVLGLSGIEGSRSHAKKTSAILNSIDPEYASALSLLLVPGTPLYLDWEGGAFNACDKYQILEELYYIMSGLDLTDCFFSSNHASNYLPIRGSVPGDKERLLGLLENAVETRDDSLLRPEYLRAL